MTAQEPLSPQQRWRLFQNDSSTVGAKKLRIGLAGSFTIEPLIPCLGGSLLGGSAIVPEFFAAPYNQIFQLCYDPKTLLEGNDTDALIILWRLEDVFSGDVDAYAASPSAEAVDRLLADIDQMADALGQLRGKYQGSLIVSTLPYPVHYAFDLRILGNGAQSSQDLHRKLADRWQSRVADIGGIDLVDLHGLLMRYGMDRAADYPKWYLYKNPYTNGFWEFLGASLSRLVKAQRQASKKCIVLDCDNTLWGGIIGEDGMAGIELGDAFPGKAFCDFQRTVLDYKNRGFLLAVASKNNLEDVMEVFENHDAMILRPQDIAVFEVHWNSKVTSLQNIAAALNISVDSLVFVDDNAKEINEVRERLPEVECLQVPEELGNFPSLLLNTDLFDRLEVTEEDRQRTQMMRAERQRDAIRTSAMSEEDFKRSLDLKIHVFEIEQKHVARVSQLINKSNQFNLTTRRRAPSEIEQLMQDAHAKVFGMEVSDRFGDYGLVGVAVITRADANAVWDIDTFLMSCRVLGRDAETSFISQIATAVQGWSGETLVGRYIPTQKNQMVKDFFANHGFDYNAANDAWVASTRAVKRPPDTVTLQLTLAKQERTGG